MEKRDIFACKLLNKKGNNHRKPRTVIPCKITTLEGFVPEEEEFKIGRNKKENGREELIEVLIKDWDEEIITSMIESEEYRDTLIERLLENRKGQQDEDTEYEYYTDGSLIDRGTENTKMGAA